MKPLFTKQDIDLILKEYPEHGLEYCASLLLKPLKQVKIKISKLRHIHNLKLVPAIYKKRLGHRKGFQKTKSDDFFVNPEQFINPKTKEVAYILGLLWADGYVYRHGYQNRVSVEMVEEDLQKLEPIFLSTGKWVVSRRVRKKRKPQMMIATNNRPLVEFLEKHEYRVKTNSSADKILSKIPSSLRPYWFRGLIDGDGCFYVNKKNHSYQFSVASSYEQDWSYVTSLLNVLGIHYILSKKQQRSKTGKINKSSCVRITNKFGIIKLGQYIYQGYETERIGLFRKYEKYKIIRGDLKPM